MALYNLADAYFVSLLNDPVQNAAVTLALSRAAVHAPAEPFRKAG